MTEKTETIELEAATATALKIRAAERGLSISELVAELLVVEGTPVTVTSAEIAELDRRWEEVKAGSRTVPNEEVVRWLRTWGTAEFRLWRDR